MRFTGIKGVLFDLDGTLIDSAPDLAAAANQMRVARGMSELAYAQLRPMAGAGARGMLGVAFGMAPDHADFPVYREEFFVNYERCMTQRTRAFDGVPELIESLVQQGFAWGVVTNKSKRFTVPLTQQMPLFATARTVVSGDSTPHSKPHPAPLLEAARQLGLDAAHCLYVGDDERDIIAGQAAGMGTVAACYGYLGQQSDVAAWGAQALIHSPGELHSLLAL